MQFLRAIAWFLREKIGWQRVGIVIGIGIVAGASFALFRILQDIEPREVLEALRGTEIGDLAAAALLVAAGYLTLTFYDYFALRTIGRADVSYRVAALAGFTSYSIGHNVGLSIFSGGTVRYRIYSTASGLSAIEVAKICFIAGLTFWLGNIAVLGLGLAVEPEAVSKIDHLPPAINRIIGIAALVALVVYVIWVSIKPRRFGRDNWRVTLPAGGLTLLQILIGVIDLGCCAAAMYVLMPDKPDIEFIPLAVIFVAATLLGFASHAPGGLGVFDVAMLIALRQFDKEDLVGALLLFRLYYYVIPFALSLAIVGIRELVFDLKPLLKANDASQGVGKTTSRRGAAGTASDRRPSNPGITPPASRRKTGRRSA